jgi:hypothetical protein
MVSGQLHASGPAYNNNNNNNNNNNKKPLHEDISIT